MSSPSLVVPWKNSTLLTVPSLSEAAVSIVTLAPAEKVALLAGLVIVTVGGEFGALTVMLTGLEVVVAPALSVAFAVRA